MQRLLEHWRAALLALATASRLGDVSLLSEAERKQVLVEWNDTAADFPADTCVHQLFEAQAASHPGRPRRPARGLRASPTASSTSAPTSSPTTCAPWASAPTCASASAWSAPPTWSSACSASSRPAAPTSRSTPLPRRAPGLHARATPRTRCSSPRSTSPMSARASQLLVLLDSTGTAVSAQPDGRPRRAACCPRASPTSSTPRAPPAVPRASCSTHRGVVNYLHWCTPGLRHRDGTGSPVHSSSPSTSPSTSLLAPLDGRPPGRPGARARAASRASARPCSTAQPQPGEAHPLAPAPARAADSRRQGRRACTRSVIIGGEALDSDTLSRLADPRARTKLVNEYGPTETVVGCCVHAVSGRSDGGPRPIGRPIANTQLYVLDAHLQPVPVGVPGELFIGGERAGPRLPRPPGAHRRALRPRPVLRHARCAPLPHRRPGALAAPTAARVPRPRSTTR